jgi:hypothetical protein
MIFFEIGLQSLWQLEFIDAVVGRPGGDDRTAEMLQRKCKIPIQRNGEHRLEEHTAGWILVVLDQAANLWIEMSLG